MPEAPYFVSYSRLPEAATFVSRLADALESGTPSFRVWIDTRELKAGLDWDEEIDEALRVCRGVLFVMTANSVNRMSVSKAEWTRALTYKKLVIPIRLDPDVVMPLRLEPRGYMNATGPFESVARELRDQLHWWHTPEGELKTLELRLADAERDLPRAENETARARITAEIDELTDEIAAKRRVVADPQAEAERAAASIERGIERDRRPEKPASGVGGTRFINPPPAQIPSYFQDRHVETKIVGDFLRNDGQRVMTVVGRGGTGKTAMACRLLKSLEHGRLPEDLGDLRVDGIVYLSASGSRRVTAQNLYSDLSKLLPEEVAQRLETLSRDPEVSTDAKVRALLASFTEGRTVVLLDNFESQIVTNDGAFAIADEDLDESLRAILDAPGHAVKVLLTTRVAPRDLALYHPERQGRLDLDEGLGSPYAETVLRELDADGTLGLRSATDDLLLRAREATRGYPRALEALHAILSADRSTSLPEVLGEADRRGLLPENVVEVLVGDAFSRLDQPTQRVMQALAVFGRPVSPTAVDYLLQHHVIGVDSAPVLKRLVNMKFARGEAGRFYLHPVDREYALSRVPQGEETDRDAVDAPFTTFALLYRAAEYFEQIRSPREEWRTIDDLEPQLTEFDLRCQAGDYETAARVLAEIDFDYLQRWGFFRLSRDLNERLHDKLDDPALLATNLGNLGNAYSNLGETRRAIGLYGQALAIDREIGDRQGEEAHLGNLGSAYANLGETRRAIELYEQALAIDREIGDRRGEAADLTNIGIASANLGDARRAIGLYEQALAIAGEIGDRRLEAADLGGLGSAYDSLGETSRAIGLYERALAIAREIGDRRLEAAHLGGLGSAYAVLGEARRSIGLYEQALAIAREIGDRRGEDSHLGGLGNAYADLGDTRHAFELYEQALAIDREIGDRQGEEAHLGNLGIASADLGDTPRAIELHEQALAIAREIGDRQVEALELINLAQALIASGSLDEARRSAEAGLEIAEAIESPQALSDGGSTIALVRLLSGDLAGARTAAAAAATHDVPDLRDNALVLTGVTALRQEDMPAAKEAFLAAMRQTDQLLKANPRNYDALDSRGLALAGLALCGAGEVPASIEAFAAARAINANPGVVSRALRLLDQLRPLDSGDVLGEVRHAAGG